MKRLIILVLVANWSAPPALAQDFPLEWHIQPDGELLLVNSSDEAVGFSGYHIMCDVDCLDLGGWRRISDALADDLLSVIGELGIGTIGFSSASSVPSSVNELNITGAAVLQPSAFWSFGYLIDGTNAQIAGWVESDQLLSSIQYSADGVHDAPIRVVPEPSSLALAALAAVGLFWRRTLRRGD